jgi:hypothetical protein
VAGGDADPAIGAEAPAATVAPPATFGAAKHYGARPGAEAGAGAKEGGAHGAGRRRRGGEAQRQQIRPWAGRIQQPQRRIRPPATGGGRQQREWSGSAVRAAAERWTAPGAGPHLPRAPAKGLVIMSSAESALGEIVKGNPKPPLRLTLGYSVLFEFYH